MPGCDNKHYPDWQVRTHSLSLNKVGHLVFAGCYETLHRQEARDTGQVRQGGTGSDQEGERWQNPRGRHHANY